MNALPKLTKLLVALALAWASAAMAADRSVWPLTPYRVEVYVAVAAELPAAPRLETALCADLATRIEAVIGAPWNATVSSAPPKLRDALLHGLTGLQSDQVPLPPPEVDKLLLVAVTAVPGGMRVTARDFDVRTRTLSPAVARPVWQLGALGDAALDAMLSAFAPLARIERVDKDQMFLRAKASALPPRDRNLALVREGDVFRPIIRYNDRDNKFRRTAPARWSFCPVEKVSPDEVRCQIYSGMRSELTTKGRGRIEPLALKVVPPSGSTLLLLQSKSEPKTPLAGYEVYTHPPGQKTALTLVGRTDRQGRLVVSPGQDLLRVLLLKNGNANLARLPIVPGLEPRLTAVIPNDDQRLGAEGFILGLREEVTDVYVRRKILMMRIHSRIEKKQFDQAAAFFDALRGLPTAEQFNMRLAHEQDRLASTDPSVQRKINTLLSDTRLLIDKQLDPQEIEDLDQDLHNAGGGDRKTADE